MHHRYFEAIHLLVGGQISGPANGPLSEFIFHDGQTPPTQEQIQAKLAELQALEPMRLLRIERNRRLTETDWIITKGLEQETDITKWKTYRQALRDLPKMITPDNSTEPLPAPTIDQQGQLMFLHWPEVPE